MATGENGNWQEWGLVIMATGENGDWRKCLLMKMVTGENSNWQKRWLVRMTGQNGYSAILWFQRGITLDTIKIYDFCCCCCRHHRHQIFNIFIMEDYVLEVLVKTSGLYQILKLIKWILNLFGHFSVNHWLTQSLTRWIILSTGCR